MKVELQITVKESSLEVNINLKSLFTAVKRALCFFLQNEYAYIELEGEEIYVSIERYQPYMNKHETFLFFTVETEDLNTSFKNFIAAAQTAEIDCGNCEKRCKKKKR